MVYVIRTTECRNGVLEKTKFPVFDVDHSRSSLRTREDKRAINRAAKNAASAKRNFARLLNHNYVQGDCFLTLDLSDAGLLKVKARADKLRADLIERGEDVPEGKDLLHMAMEQEMENLNRRVLRACKAAGVEYLYATAVSDMTDREDVECTARLHIHAVVNQAVEEIVKKKWTLGAVESKSLSAWASGGVPDWTALAEYIIGQTRTVGNGKRYTVSRNLQKPPHKDRIAIRPDALLRAPAGAVLLEQGQYIPGRAQYIRYMHPLWNREEVADELPT